MTPEVGFNLFRQALRQRRGAHRMSHWFQRRIMIGVVCGGLLLALAGCGAPADADTATQAIPGGPRESMATATPSSDGILADARSFAAYHGVGLDVILYADGEVIEIRDDDGGLLARAGEEIRLGGDISRMLRGRTNCCASYCRPRVPAHTGSRAASLRAIFHESWRESLPAYSGSACWRIISSSASIRIGLVIAGKPS
jgi:hypothetical protein